MTPAGWADDVLEAGASGCMSAFAGLLSGLLLSGQDFSVDVVDVAAAAASSLPWDGTAVALSAFVAGVGLCTSLLGKGAGLLPSLLLLAITDELSPGGESSSFPAIGAYLSVGELTASDAPLMTSLLSFDANRFSMISNEGRPPFLTEVAGVPEATRGAPAAADRCP